MRAQQLLEGGIVGFSAATSKAVQEAFGRAWLGVAPRYAGDSSAGDKARLRLAECVLAVTTAGEQDSANIERLALMMFRVIGRRTGEDNQPT